jgi:PEP-CTERM motif
MDQFVLGNTRADFAGTWILHGDSMRTTLALATACLIVVSVSETAHASLISINDGFYGVGAITRDTVAGKDWLDLTLSTGFTINGILGGGGGFVGQGFHVATLTEVESLFTAGGWDGIDDTGTGGTVGHLTFVNSMRALLGSTSGTFTEGWALSSVLNQASRPFLADPGNGLGRVACTTAGFNAFPTPINSFNSCRMDYDQSFPFIGAFLVRNTVPEPGTLILLGSGLAAIGVRWLARHRRASAINS